MKNKMIDELPYLEIETEWKKIQSQKDFGREILETMNYDEAKDLLIPLLESRIDIKSDLSKSYKKLANLVKKQFAPETFEFDFTLKALWILRFIKKDIENQNQLNNLERFWIFNETRKPNSQNQYQKSDEDFSLLIEEAKKIPLENLLNTDYKKSGTNTLTLYCPFHKEKSPSFTVFVNSNTYYCFGCHAQGDSISFYQKTYGVDFIEAVKKLTGRI